MDIDFVMKAIGVGITVAVSCQILKGTGREDQATLVSLAGVIALLVMLFGEARGLFDTIRDIFGI